MRILIPIGDPNGIGPELAVKASLSSDLDKRVTIIIVGDKYIIEHYVTLIGGENIEVFDDEKTYKKTSHREISVVDVPSLSPDKFRPGKPNTGSGKATVDYVKRSLELANSGYADGVIACPHNEEAVNNSGFKFQGYPSLIESLLCLEPQSMFLLLASKDLKICHVTLHQALRSALDSLDSELVCKAAVAAIQTVKKFGIEHPKLGIMSINPHVGEGGLMGEDDVHITIPAAGKLRSEGYEIIGPQDGGALLAENDCDAYLAMYHDQGHLPVKARAGRSCVAYSIGANIIFASVGHGSAMDIAGLGVADVSPILLACNSLGATR